MSERSEYEPGTPSWVDLSSPDPDAAAGFYGELLGWETEDQMPLDMPGQYFMCRVRGRDVAAIGTQQAEDAPPMWNTYVSVASADESAATVRKSGGTVLGEPSTSSTPAGWSSRWTRPGRPSASAASRCRPRTRRSAGSRY